jgi:DNA-binding NtrC family response regulator
MSGYQKDEKVQELLAAGAAGFVAKPFTLDEVEREVLRALEEEEEG